MPRRRLDTELVRRKLVTSTQDAVSVIEEGRVLVGNAPAANPARMVAPDEPVHVLGIPARFVSRAGEKLDAALEHFTVQVAGSRALDAGASTGGFTDCLLQRGAAQVVAVDVGYGQMVEPVRSDSRVRIVDRTNIRTLTLDALHEAPFDLVVADLSFISLLTVGPALAGLGGDNSEFVLLVKPQFEADHDEVSAGRGVLHEPAIWRRVLASTVAGLASAGIAVNDAMASPLRGASGNLEFLVHGLPGTRPVLADTVLDNVVAAVVADAEADTDGEVVAQRPPEVGV